MAKTVAELLERNNNNLDLIRLICAVFVIWGHVPAFMVGVHNFDVFTEVFPFTYMGAVAVKVFFFISGLLVTNSLLRHGDWRKYVISRFFRIYPALLVCVFLSVIVCFLLWFKEGVSVAQYIHDAFRYIRHIASLHFVVGIENVSFMTNRAQEHSAALNGSLWTIPTEVAMYMLLLGVWLFSTSFIKSKRILIIIGAFFVVSPIFCRVYGTSEEEHRWLISMFFSGSLFAIFADEIRMDCKLPVGFFICALLLKENVDLWHLLAYLSLVTFFVWLSGVGFIRKVKIPCDISYGVYLYGWPIQQFVLYKFPEIGYSLYLFVSIVFSMIFGFYSCVLIERPCIKFGKKLCCKFDK